jgi:hypothetical protein
MATRADQEETDDFDVLSGFVLETLKTGQIGIVKAMAMGKPLKRQAGKMPKAMGHLVRRYCQDDEKAAALIELASQQSPAFAKLAESWGLKLKEVEVVKDATP